MEGNTMANGILLFQMGIAVSPSLLEECRYEIILRYLTVASLVFSPRDPPRHALSHSLSLSLCNHCRRKVNPKLMSTLGWILSRAEAEIIHHPALIILFPAVVNINRRAARSREIHAERIDTSRGSSRLSQSPRRERGAGGCVKGDSEREETMVMKSISKVTRVAAVLFMSAGQASRFAKTTPRSSLPSPLNAFILSLHEESRLTHFSLSSSPPFRSCAFVRACLQPLAHDAGGVYLRSARLVSFRVSPPLSRGPRRG